MFHQFLQEGVSFGIFFLGECAKNRLKKNVTCTKETAKLIKTSMQEHQNMDYLLLHDNNNNNKTEIKTREIGSKTCLGIDETSNLTALQCQIAFIASRQFIEHLFLYDSILANSNLNCFCLKRAAVLI
jgi:hypothetical protein